MMTIAITYNRLKQTTDIGPSASLPFPNKSMCIRFFSPVRESFITVTGNRRISWGKKRGNKSKNDFVLLG